MGQFSFKGSNVITFDHVTVINRYISSYRGHRGYIHPHKRLSRHRLFVSILCDNKIQQILQERKMLSW